MRKIYIYVDDFVPHGQGCQADKQIEGETVHCDAPAVCGVAVDSKYRYVCREHLEYLKRDIDAQAT